MSHIPVSRRYPLMTWPAPNRVLWGRAIGSGWGAGGDPMALAARWQLRLANAGSVSSRPNGSGGGGGRRAGVTASTP
jgi:hypothetical protein